VVKINNRIFVDTYYSYITWQKVVQKMLQQLNL
jgi:hypothetical protein